MSKFKIQAGVLAEGLGALTPLIPHKTNREILKNIKISALPGDAAKNIPDSINLMVSDLEIYAQKTLSDTGILVLAKGDILVPGQSFLDFVKSFGTNDLLSIEKNEVSSQIKIECGGAKFELGLQEVTEYPNFPEIPEKGKSFHLGLDVFTRLLNKTEFSCADKNSPRVELTAICVSCSKDTIQMMATDAKRASIASGKLKSEITEDRNFLVSPRALSQIIKMATAGDVKLLISESTLFVLGNESSVSVQLLDAKFPPVEDLIPKYTKKITLNVADFLSQLKRVSLATDSKNTVKMKIQEGSITLTSRNREQNKSATVNYTCEYTGDPLNVAMDVTLLIDALKACENPQIDFYFEDAEQTLFFTENGFQYILAVLE